MTDSDLINLLNCLVMFLVVVNIILALVALWLVTKLWRPRQKFGLPEIPRDSQGRRIKQRV